MFPIPHTPEEWFTFLTTIGVLATLFFVSGYGLGRWLMRQD